MITTTGVNQKTHQLLINKKTISPVSIAVNQDHSDANNSFLLDNKAISTKNSKKVEVRVGKRIEAEGQPRQRQNPKLEGAIVPHNGMVTAPSTVKNKRTTSDTKANQKPNVVKFITTQ